jgi:thiol-disulfide isomerase/thioredoxin
MKTAISIISLALISIFFSTFASANSKESAFSNISLLTAKELAGVEKKLIYVDFYADWCVPCNWMNETTYNDAAVLSKLRSNFIPVKVNIDDFDGFTLKEEYKIKVLPTILILDENGKVVKRFEESISSSKLKDILENAATGTIVNDNMGLNVSPSSLNKNKLFEENSTVKTTKMKYRVQVGVFSDYANTERVLKRLYDNFNEPVVVVTDFLNNKTVYRVFAGDCETQDEAEQLRDEIERKTGIKGFVKAFESHSD